MVQTPSLEPVESIVLASMIHSEIVREDCIKVLTVDSFYAREHRAIYSELFACQMAGHTPDYILIEQELKGSSRQLLSEIWWTTASYKNVAKLIKKLLAVQKLRGALLVAQNVQRQVELSNDDGDVQDHLLAIEDETSKYADVLDSGNGLEHVKDLAGSAMQAFNDAQDESKQRLIKTGINTIDDAIGGFVKGEYIVLAGRPSQGKTSLGLTLMNNMSKTGLNIGKFSLEMSSDQVVNRLISIESNYSEVKVTGKHLRGVEKSDKFVNASYIECAERLSTRNIFIDECGEQTVDSIESGIRSMIRKNSLDVIIIDYISLVMALGGNRARHEVVADISKRLRAMFKSLNVCGIVLSQLARDAQNKKPILSDLSESGQIERDAHIVIAINKPNLEHFWATELLVLKAREGGFGDYPTAFCTDTTEFRDMSSGERAIFQQIVSEKPKSTDSF